MFKKLCFISVLLLVSSTALAFGGGGGGGGGSRSRSRSSGVDSIGIHIGGGNSPSPDVTFGCDDPNATPDIYGICTCNEGYQNEQGACVVDACRDFIPEGCQTECNSSEGSATYILCHGTGTCINNSCNYDPVIECDQECGECETCDTSSGVCISDDDREGFSCSIGVCQNGECINLCQSQQVSPCMKCNPETGDEEPDSSLDGTSCGYGAHFVCQAGLCVCDASKHYTAKAGVCVCLENYYGTANTQCNPCPENASCPGGESFNCLNGYESNGSACVCNTNKYVANGQCLDCPTNATCDGTNFTCINGYSVSGNSCVCSQDKYVTAGQCLDCPANATCDGSIFTCQNGYESNGSACICNTNKYIANGQCLDCPANATCDGSTFTCQDEYENNGTGCIQCTTPGTVYDPLSKACVCDTSNNWTDNGNGGCTCATNHKLEQDGTVCALDACIALRAQYPKCLDQCTSENGVVTTATYHTTCSDDNGDNDNWSCNAISHVCENPCAIGEHNTDACTLSWTANNGICIPEYADTTTACTLNEKTGFFCDGQGQCICPEGSYITDADGSCATCPSSNSNTLSSAECSQCPDTWYQEGTCFSSCPDPDTYWRSSDTGAPCVECSDTKNAKTPISVESCAKCSGLRYIEPNKSGGPKCWSCNQDKTLSAYPFTGSKGFRGGYEARLQEFIDLCNSCPNRFYNTETTYCECLNKAGDKCCKVGEIAQGNECVSATATCTSGTTFYSYDEGQCIPCGTEGHKTDRNECEACGMVFVTSQGTCYNKPPEGQIMDNNGNVFDCTSYISVLGVTLKNMCDSCSNRFYSIRDARTDCIRCDDYLSYPSTLSECSKCPNRTFNEETGLCSCGVEKETVTRMVPEWNSTTHSFSEPTEQQVRICPEPVE